MSYPVHSPFSKIEIDAFIIFFNKEETERHGKVPVPFSRADQPFADLCASLAATYLHTVNEGSKLKIERFQKTEGLLMLDSLYQNFSFGSFIHNVETRCAQFFNAERATFLVCDEIRRQLYRRIAHPNSHDTLESFPCERGIAGYVATSCAPTSVSGVPYDQRYIAKIDDPNGLKSGDIAREILAVPIIMGTSNQKEKKALDLPNGVLILINKTDGGPFSQEDSEYLSSFAPLIGRTLDIIMKYERFLSLGDLFSNLNTEMGELSSGLDQNAGYYQTLRRNYQFMSELFGAMHQPDRNPLLRGTPKPE